MMTEWFVCMNRRGSDESRLERQEWLTEDDHWQYIRGVSHSTKLSTAEYSTQVHHSDKKPSIPSPRVPEEILSISWLQIIHVSQLWKRVYCTYHRQWQPISFQLREIENIFAVQLNINRLAANKQTTQESGSFWKLDSHFRNLQIRVCNSTNTNERVPQQHASGTLICIKRQS